MKNKIFDYINNSKSILLLTHESPDGDAIGSVLSFYHYLSSINKSVDMVILDIPNVFNFLPSINNVVDNVDNRYDLGLVLDCANKERIGQNEDLLSKCDYTISIDHHVSNTKFCDTNYIDAKSSSCCQVIYTLFKDWKIDFNTNIGESLVTGMLTDTGGFSNDNVDFETYAMASELSRLGVAIHSIYDAVISKKTMPQYNLMKIAMDRLEFLEDGKIAFTYILKEDYEKVGASLGDHEGIVNIGRNIAGVEVSVFIREDELWKISLRSNGKIDVNKVASVVGGGGHHMAAGGKYNGTLKETKELLINEIIKDLN